MCALCVVSGRAVLRTRLIIYPSYKRQIYSTNTLFDLLDATFDTCLSKYRPEQALDSHLWKLEVRQAVYKPALFSARNEITDPNKKVFISNSAASKNG